MCMSIGSIGYYLPEQVVTNDDLVGLTRTYGGPNVDIEGLKKKLLLNKADQRYFKRPDETGFEMALIATKRCLEKVNFHPKDLDLILYAGMLRDYVEPAMGILLQDSLGAINANAFDMTNACNGFLNAMEVASLYIKTGKYRKILIVGAEDGSERIPWQMFNNVEHFTGFSALTVSDAAAAMLLQSCDSGINFQTFDFKTYGQYNDLCRIKIGKEENDLKIMVKSKELVKTAMEIMTEFAPFFIQKAEKAMGKFDIWFGHQVTGDPKKFYKLPEEMYEKTYNSFSKVGNTGSVSLPIGMALAEEEGRLKRGDHVVLIVGASGFSVGGTFFIY